MGLRRFPGCCELAATAVPRSSRLCGSGGRSECVDTDGVARSRRYPHARLEGVRLRPTGGDGEDDNEVREARYEAHGPHSIASALDRDLLAAGRPGCRRGRQTLSEGMARAIRWSVVLRACLGLRGGALSARRAAADPAGTAVRRDHDCVPRLGPTAHGTAALEVVSLRQPAQPIALRRTRLQAARRTGRCAGLSPKTWIPGYRHRDYGCLPDL